MDFLPLTLNKEFKRVYGRGQSLVHPMLVTYFLKNRTGTLRVGITASTKLGCAVKRNRARRVIKEAVRQAAASISGYDLVFVARGRTLTCKSTALIPVVKGHMETIIKGVKRKDAR